MSMGAWGLPAGSKGTKSLGRTSGGGGTKGGEGRPVQGTHGKGSRKTWRQ